MLNSSEEVSYWYLRLNGFFILDNFVIHKSDDIKFTSDADLIAIRNPFVFEEIGGQEYDWDNDLFEPVDDGVIIGVICQVKGGAIGNKPLFSKEHISYCINRMGFVEEVDEIVEILNDNESVDFENSLGQKFHIVKILISRDAPPKDLNALSMRLKHIYGFIEQRIRNYPIEKYRDRNFFSSIAFQILIEKNKLEEE